MLLSLAALDYVRRPPEVRSTIRTNGQDLRSAVRYARESLRSPTSTSPKPGVTPWSSSKRFTPSRTSCRTSRAAAMPSMRAAWGFFVGAGTAAFRRQPLWRNAKAFRRPRRTSMAANTPVWVQAEAAILFTSGKRKLPREFRIRHAHSRGFRPRDRDVVCSRCWRTRCCARNGRGLIPRRQHTGPGALPRRRRGVDRRFAPVVDARRTRFPVRDRIPPLLPRN